MKSRLVNIEAECDALGAMIESVNARNEILNILTVDDFYDANEANKLVFKAIEKLVQDGIAVDVTSLTNELGVNMKCLEKVGGVEYLIDLQERYLGDKNAINHAHIVKDLSLGRNLSKCLNKYANGLEKKEFSDIGQYVAECEREILDITQARRVSEFELAGDIVETITDELKLSRGKKNKKTKGVTTGFQVLDYYTKGWLPGQFNIIGARPSVGKTAFAINLAYHAASQTGRTVAFFSLEMDAKSIVQRLLSLAAMVSSDAITDGNLTDSDWLSLDNAVNALKKCKLLIDDTPGEKLTDIKTKLHKLKAQNPDLSVVFIDYLGLITTNMKAESRQNEVAEISRQLKALAREVEVPIICLSQLSRDNEKKSSDRLPKLSDLRDSGAIEQDADIVLFIHREDYQKNDKESGNKDITDTNPLGDISDTTILVAKNRNGSTGPIKFSMAKKIGKFMEVDTRKEN